MKNYPAYSVPGAQGSLLKLKNKWCQQNPSQHGFQKPFIYWRL